MGINGSTNFQIIAFPLASSNVYWDFVVIFKRSWGDKVVDVDEGLHSH